MALNLSKLTNVKRTSGKISAACPACRNAYGGDKSGNHLAIFASGKYHCIFDPSPEHSRAIWALVGEGTSETFEPAPLPVELPKTWPLSVLDRLVKDYSYWATRGISQATVEPFQGGVAMEGQMKGRFVFPIFNRHEEIVAFSGRAINAGAKPSWRHLGGISQGVWGGLDEIDSCRRVVLVESIGDSLMLREHDVPESICLFGVNLPEAVLAHLIAANPEQIIISTNNDVKHDVGQRAAERIRFVLSSFFSDERLKVALPSHKDFGVMNTQQIDDWRREHEVD